MSVQPAMRKEDLELLYEAQLTLIARFRRTYVDMGDEGERQLLLLLNDIREQLELNPLTERQWREIVDSNYFSSYL